MSVQESPYDNSETRSQVVDMLEGKLNKKDVNYLSQDAREESGQEVGIGSSCMDCGNYVSYGKPKSKCEIVIGTVEAGGVCDSFDPSISGQGDSHPPQGHSDAARY